MKVKEKGHTIVIKKSDEQLADLITKINESYATFQKHNLIIDLCDSKVEATDLELFNTLHETHKENKKSFIVVFENADFNEMDEEGIVVVPSIQEAQDIIEMEEIERDLGF